MAGKSDIEGENGCGVSCKGIEVPTEDERIALAAMKRIKGRVRGLKKRLSHISSTGSKKGSEEIRELERELEKLKIEWNEWEGKREKAARERMILLGHEER
jgi:hypothetical protein